jgi:hypothetical protein
MELWDVEANKKKIFIGNKNNTITFATFSPDFSYTISLETTQNKNVYAINFYDTKTGTYKYCVYLSLPKIKSIALSPSNKTLALALDDDFGTIYFLKTPQELHSSSSISNTFFSEKNNACQSVEYWTFLFIINSFYQETTMPNGMLDIYEQSDLDFEIPGPVSTIDDSMALNGANISGNGKKSVICRHGREEKRKNTPEFRP